MNKINVVLHAKSNGEGRTKLQKELINNSPKLYRNK